jgi:hypothetical protein
VIATLLAAALAAAEPTPSAEPGAPAAAPAPSPPVPGPKATPAPPSEASRRLDRLKALAGTWTGSAGFAGRKPDEVRVEWRLTGGGTAVAETLFAGTPHEMMTVYHLDGPELIATHYCSLGNAPTLRAVRSDPDTIAFELVRGANMKPSDPHMHAARITFVGPDRLRTEWTSWQGGKEAGVARFDLSREKRPPAATATPRPTGGPSDG